ncbi:MAG: tetratricopeptide repeat protein [Isosphaeraceae bacterium]
MNQRISLALAIVLALALCDGTALAQRAGGRAGGARPGPGAQAGARPAFNRTPAFNAPTPAARPQAPAAARPTPVARPTPGPVARPTPGPLPAPGGGNRPGIGGGGGNAPNLGNRPGIGGGGGNAPNLGNRPGIGGGGGNAPNLGNRPGIGNNAGNNIVNRPGIGNNAGNNIVNRPNNSVNVGINRPGGAVNSGNNRTINNVNNNVNNVNVNRPSWTNGNPNWAYRPGWSNHQSWVNGYWHGQNNSNWWNNGGAFMTGLAVGGIGAWGIGSAVYNWGYRPFVNPYFITQPVVIQQPVPTTVVVQQPVPVQQPAAVVEAAPIDYSQPLNTSAAAPDPTTADPAMQTFDAARAAFKAGNYAEALQQTDQVLKTLPSDAAINEFRALCLFAIKQYDQAAATLYAVLSAGPGWDWTTLSGLYPSVDVYTEQVRALEDYRTAQPQSASARFVLAYHYLTQGHTEAAVEELKEVVKLQPGDQLSAQLVAQLSGDKTTSSPDAPAPSPAQAPSAVPAPAVQGNLVGAWKASPALGTTIELTLGGDSKFNWNIVTQGKTQPIAGTYAYENGILTLTQSENNAMVGKVAWLDESHFKFQAMGGGPNDPGLAFGK